VILTAYAALALLSVMLFPHPAALLPILGCAFILSGCINAGHDCVHSTHLRIRRWDRVAGSVWCVPILVNFTIYHRQHLLHHRFPGVACDTEHHSHFTTLTQYLIAQSGLGFWKSILRRLILSWRGDFPASINSAARVRAARADNLLIALWLMIAAAATAWRPLEMLAAYWLPVALYPAFVLFFGLPEHFALQDEAVPWPRARNVRSNALVRFFQWNANYHALHHRSPGLPAHAFAAHLIPAGGADPLERSYLAFHLRLAFDLHRRGRAAAADPLVRERSSD
jgi:fatty acid desaturase